MLISWHRLFKEKIYFMLCSVIEEDCVEDWWLCRSLLEQIVPIALNMLIHMCRTDHLFRVVSLFKPKTHYHGHTGPFFLQYTFQGSRKKVLNWIEWKRLKLFQIRIPEKTFDGFNKNWLFCISSNQKYSYRIVE